MTYPDPEECYTDTDGLDASLQDAAEARGMSLEPDRLEELIEAAESIRLLSRSPDAESMDFGFEGYRSMISVGRTAFSERFGTTAARVEFMPWDGEELLEDGAEADDRVASPERATILSLMAIRGVQDYVLLVDAGVIKRPAILYGSTNPEMAIVAERCGLYSDTARQSAGNRAAAHKAMRQMDEVAVYGSFDEIGERVFSAETKRLEDVLTRRLAAAQPAGEAALGT